MAINMQTVAKLGEDLTFGVKGGPFNKTMSSLAGKIESLSKGRLDSQNSRILSASLMGAGGFVAAHGVKKLTSGFRENHPTAGTGLNLAALAATTAAPFFRGFGGGSAGARVVSKI